MEVESDMKQILINRFQIAKDVITSEAEFKKDLGLDSLDVMELVIELENAFNIHIADEDAASILTFGDAVTCVQAGIRP
jgi:acyl carrier protein